MLWSNYSNRRDYLIYNCSILYNFFNVLCLCYVDLPSNPENLHVVGTSKGQVFLEWQPAKETREAPIEEYVIEMAVGDSSNYKQIATVDANECKFDAKGLKDGQKYNFRIKALNRAGPSQGYAKLDKQVTASATGKRDDCLGVMSDPSTSKFGCDYFS